MKTIFASWQVHAGLMDEPGFVALRRARNQAARRAFLAISYAPGALRLSRRREDRCHHCDKSGCEDRCFAAELQWIFAILRYQPLDRRRQVKASLAPDRIAQVEIVFIGQATGRSAHGPG